MSTGFLEQCFEGVAVKRLSAVETTPERSHQHEFNGVDGLKKILGTGENEEKFLRPSSGRVKKRKE